MLKVSPRHLSGCLRLTQGVKGVGLRHIYQQGSLLSCFLTGTFTGILKVYLIALFSLLSTRVVEHLDHFLSIFYKVTQVFVCVREQYMVIVKVMFADEGNSILEGVKINKECLGSVLPVLESSCFTFGL